MLEAKCTIEKHAKVWVGLLIDSEIMKLANISKNTYYKHEREIMIFNGEIKIDYIEKK